MRSLIATWGRDVFVEAANKVVRREIMATFDAGRTITILRDGQLTRLNRENFERMDQPAELEESKS